MHCVQAQQPCFWFGAPGGCQRWQALAGVGGFLAAVDLGLGTYLAMSGSSLGRADVSRSKHKCVAAPTSAPVALSALSMLSRQCRSRSQLAPLETSHGKAECWLKGRMHVPPARCFAGVTQLSTSAWCSSMHDRAWVSCRVFLGVHIASFICELGLLSVTLIKLLSLLAEPSTQAPQATTRCAKHPHTFYPRSPSVLHSSIHALHAVLMLSCLG